MDVPSPPELLRRLHALPAARELLELLGEDPRVHLVGGAVRDLLLGREPHELDLVVEGDAAAVARRLGASPRIHPRFGTATVALRETTVDLAGSRRERYPHPGALPEVEPAPLPEDLRRRDFTINAIALVLGGEGAGGLVAVPHALGDLAGGVLRVLHERSFRDDPTRLLRLVRYASRLGFSPDSGTAALARAAAGDGALVSVSGARIGAELRLLAREADPVAALLALHGWELDVALDPHFGLREPAKARIALGLLGERGRSDLLVLGLAVREVPGGQLAELLDRWAFPGTEREVIMAVASRAAPLAQALASATGPGEIAALGQSAPAELVAAAGGLGPHRQASACLRLRDVELEIGGEDLIAAGVAPGPAVGHGLRAALAAKRDGRAPGREAELAEALRAANERQSGH